MCAGEAVPPGSDQLAGEQYRKSTFISDEARSTGDGRGNGVCPPARAASPEKSKKNRPILCVPFKQMNSNFQRGSPHKEKNNVTRFDSPARAGSTVTFGVFKIELPVMGDTLLKNSISFLP